MIQINMEMPEMDEKASHLAEIMFQEDAERVKRGGKPFYQTEEDFYSEHPEYKTKIADFKS